MRLSKIVSTTVLATVLLSSTALAAGGGGHSAPDHVPISVYFHVVNLFLTLVLLVKFVRPMLRDYLVNRHDTVKEALHSAENARLEAEAAAAEYRNKLAELQSSMQNERAKAEKLAKEESASIIANAKVQAAEIRSSTEKVINDEVRNIRAGLQAQVTQMALDLAIKMVKDSVDTSDHRRIYDDYVSTVKTSEVN